MDSLSALFSSLDVTRASRRPSFTPSFNVTQSSPGATTLRTSEVSVVSHTHGRERREARGIEKHELQEAVKYGRKDRANPGRNGEPRWRFTHKGVVYITDYSKRHEITSWRIDGCEEIPPAQLSAGGECGAQVVLVVDHSGSMRKDDVKGYPTRTAAVYDCLARELIEPQLKVAGAAAVTLIEMSDTAEVVCGPVDIDEAFLKFAKQRMTRRARSHGNYLPALDKVIELFGKEAANQKQLWLLFLSDGAPSDHAEMSCNHGYQVWQPGPPGSALHKGKPRLQNCPISNTCRQDLLEHVRLECVRRVRKLGDLFGRDRVHIGCVAFGPPNEDYRVLQQMASELPKGTFQKLGLAATGLKTTFTSLTTSLTTLRTDIGSPRSRRSGVQKQTAAEREETNIDVSEDEWVMYRLEDAACREKLVYDPTSKSLVKTSFIRSAVGVAYARKYFGAGAERHVFQCTEIDSNNYSVGPTLVAKQSIYEDDVADGGRTFHTVSCRIQSEAGELAKLFNRRLQGASRGNPEWNVEFLQPFVFKVHDWDWSQRADGLYYFFAEPELEGTFIKWNNNAGGVKKGGGVLHAISEEAEDGTKDDIPQAFSHFSYSATHGRKLVCDLQGVWNHVDGFLLTDPVIHTASGKGKNGATDKGPDGIKKFFESHRCNALCRRLGLTSGCGCV